MAGSRFNPFFAVLMTLAFLAAFVFHMPAAGNGALQGLFSPVSRPVRLLASLLFRRIDSQPTVDDRSTSLRPQSSVYDENHRLLTAYASLQMKFDQLGQLNADRQAVGDIRSLCKPATVTGAGDVSGMREALTVNAAAPAATLIGRPVIRGNPSQSPLPCDLIGRVVRSGPAGAQVRLVTDPGFRLTARIARYVAQSDGQLKLTYIGQLHPLVQGVGANTMAIQSNLSTQQVKDNDLRVNDLVLLDDNEWPANIQGFEVGRIVSITRQVNAPLLAEIRIEPQSNLMRLTEVMVMVKN